MVDVVDARPVAVRRIYWDRPATFVTVVLAVITAVTLARLSGIYHYDVLTTLTAWVFPPVLGFVWLILMVRAVMHRRIWGLLFVLPVVVALLATADNTEFPAKLRWDLSRSSMDAYVQSLPSPPPPLTRAPSETEADTYDSAFTGTCPSLLGTYRVVGCRTIPGGYVFLTSVEDSGVGTGVAYLPLTGDSFNWSMQLLDDSNSVNSWPLEQPWHVVLIRES